MGHIQPNETLPYTIRFENDKEAVASAQLVTITDPLSPHLDYSTFTLGDMEFSNHHITVPPGLKHYSTRVDLRPEGNNLLVDIEGNFDPSTGMASWTFTAIDPATGEQTEDPLAGFLPPNGDNHEGEGYVKFSIKPSSNLPAGTKIENVATIVFDWNPPMDTPLVFNTIDAGTPASQVTALPAHSPGQFAVTWTGQDDADGSGIAGYDIYVSENGGPYKLWLKNTTATSGTFSGKGDSAYAFYSIATDNVGHHEQAPETPDAITTVSINRPPLKPALHYPVQMNEITTSTPALQISNSSDPDGDALTYEFEIYPNASLTPPAITSANGVVEGASITSWTCGINLPKNTWYSWRARAFDGVNYSEWMEEGATFYARAVEIRVSPGGSIQAAINAAGNGDVVSIEPGTYTENISFMGKAIMVMGTMPDIAVDTIIDGDGKGSVVTFDHGEQNNSLLMGLTLRNGKAPLGGGILCRGSSPTIMNCVIVRNISSGAGGGIYCEDASPILTNCTLSSNTALSGGGVYCDNSTPRITNCILWGDSPNEIHVSDDSLLTSVTYSDIQDGYGGIGNINQNPLFIDSGAGNYSLQPASPCIDAGTSQGAPDRDKNGIARPQDGNGDHSAEYDIGAYEMKVDTQVRISGGAYNFPETATYKASFSMDVTGPSSPSGWFKYYYSRTRMNFVSTQVTTVSIAGSTATISGTGTVNGVGGYTFTATVTDGSPDSFGIIINKPDNSPYYSKGPATTSGGDLIISAP
ncbi:MAG: choice-of-anchor Q domain-containing protein [bacterium]